MIKLIIQEIIIEKCQNCVLTPTFRVSTHVTLRLTVIFHTEEGLHVYTPETSVLIHNFDTSR